MSTPTRRALLIASPRSGLVSAVPSVQRMAEFLLGPPGRDADAIPDAAVRDAFDKRRGFAAADVRCVVGERATRSTIVAAFADLLADTGPDDAVVVYWAGHGGLFPDIPAADVAPTWFRPHPVLEPMDIADSDEHHFNGLLGGEVRLLLRGLARLCDNVTAIFDCCHASGLVEVDRPAADTSDADDRAFINSVAERAARRVARRRDQPKDPHRSGAGATTGVVRLVASSGSERAYADHATGRLHFTDALVDALLDPALAHLAWDPLIRLVRARVQAVRPEQRPGVEGACERLPFTTIAAHPPADHFHVHRRHALLRLAAGSAAGVRRDDQFELLAYTADVPLTTAGVETLKPFHAHLDATRGHPPLPAAMIARRLRRGDVDLAARLASAATDVDRAAALARTAALAGAAIDPADTRADPVARPTDPSARDGAAIDPAARATDPAARPTDPAGVGYRLRPPIVGDTPPGHLDLLDERAPDDRPLAAPQVVARVELADPRGFDDLARALARLERWAALHDQLRRPGLGPLTGCYALTWGRVLPGVDDLVPWSPGDLLPAGSELGLRVRNPGRAAALHFQAFRVRADRSVVPWRDVAGGLAVPARHELPLTDRFTPLPHLPGPQTEWLVVALGDGAFDLSGLVTPAALQSFAVRGDDPGALPCEATRVEILGVPYTLAATPVRPKPNRA